MTHETTAVHIAKRCALSWWELSIEYGFSLYTRCWWISESYLSYDLIRFDEGPHYHHRTDQLPNETPTERQPQLRILIENPENACNFFMEEINVYLPLFLGNMPHHQGSKSPSPIMMNHTINSLTECTFYLVIEGHYNLNGWLRMFF